MYIKLVVIVNAGFFVDKSVFFNKIIDLGHEKVAGQALYRGRTLTVKEKACGQSRRLCTSGPVDIHGLIHRLAWG
jgi:hypothetical protein